MKLNNIILEYRTKEYDPEEVNVDEFSTKENLNAKERDKLERDLAFTLLGGYKCKYCGEEFKENSSLDLHHGLFKYKDLKKSDKQLKRGEEPWHIINQTKQGRGFSVLCPKCHREVTAEEIKKEKKEQPELFSKKEIEKSYKKSEKKIEIKEKIGSLFEKALTQEDYEDFIENLHEKRVDTRFREGLNNYLIEYIKNNKKEFYKMVAKKRKTFESEKAKMDFDDKVVSKIRNIINYYYSDKYDYARKINALRTSLNRSLRKKKYESI